MRVGDDGSQARMPDTLVVSNYGMSVDAIMAIPEEYVFDPEDSYCPQSDVPMWLHYADGTVQYWGKKVYVVGDNGMCMFIIRGRKS